MSKDQQEKPPTTRELIALRRVAAGKPVAGYWRTALVARGWVYTNLTMKPAGEAVLTAHPSPVAEMNRRRREKGPRPPLNVNVAREVQADMRAAAEARGLGLGEAWEQAGRAWLDAQEEHR